MYNNEDFNEEMLARMQEAMREEEARLQIEAEKREEKKKKEEEKKNKKKPSNFSLLTRLVRSKARAFIIGFGSAFLVGFGIFLFARVILPMMVSNVIVKYETSVARADANEVVHIEEVIEDEEGNEITVATDSYTIDESFGAVLKVTNDAVDKSFGKQRRIAKSAAESLAKQYPDFDGKIPERKMYESTIEEDDGTIVGSTKATDLIHSTVKVNGRNVVLADLDKRLKPEEEAQVIEALQGKSFNLAKTLATINSRGQSSATRTLASKMVATATVATRDIPMTQGMLKGLEYLLSSPKVIDSMFEMEGENTPIETTVSRDYMVFDWFEREDYVIGKKKFKKEKFYSRNEYMNDEDLKEKDIAPDKKIDGFDYDKVATSDDGEYFTKRDVEPGLGNYKLVESKKNHTYKYEEMEKTGGYVNLADLEGDDKKEYEEQTGKKIKDEIAAVEGIEVYTSPIIKQAPYEEIGLAILQADLQKETGLFGKWMTRNDKRPDATSGFELDIISEIERKEEELGETPVVEGIGDSFQGIVEGNIPDDEVEEVIHGGSIWQGDKDGMLIAPELDSRDKEEDKEEEKEEEVEETPEEECSRTDYACRVGRELTEIEIASMPECTEWSTNACIEEGYQDRIDAWIESLKEIKEEADKELEDAGDVDDVKKAFLEPTKNNTILHKNQWPMVDATGKFVAENALNVHSRIEATYINALLREEDPISPAAFQSGVQTQYDRFVKAQGKTYMDVWNEVKDSGTTKEKYETLLEAPYYIYHRQNQYEPISAKTFHLVPEHLQRFPMSELQSMCPTYGPAEMSFCGMPVKMGLDKMFLTDVGTFEIAKESIKELVLPTGRIYERKASERPEFISYVEANDDGVEVEKWRVKTYMDKQEEYVEMLNKLVTTMAGAGGEGMGNEDIVRIALEEAALDPSETYRGGKYISGLNPSAGPGAVHWCSVFVNWAAQEAGFTDGEIFPNDWAHQTYVDHTVGYMAEKGSRVVPNPVGGVYNGNTQAWEYYYPSGALESSGLSSEDKEFIKNFTPKPGDLSLFFFDNPGDVLPSIDHDWAAYFRNEPPYNINTRHLGHIGIITGVVDEGGREVFHSTEGNTQHPVTQQYDGSDSVVGGYVATHEFPREAFWGWVSVNYPMQEFDSDMLNSLALNKDTGYVSTAGDEFGRGRWIGKELQAILKEIGEEMKKGNQQGYDALNAYLKKNLRSYNENNVKKVLNQIYSRPANIFVDSKGNYKKINDSETKRILVEILDSPAGVKVQNKFLKDEIDKYAKVLDAAGITNKEMQQLAITVMAQYTTDIKFYESGTGALILRGFKNEPYTEHGVKRALDSWYKILSMHREKVDVPEGMRVKVPTKSNYRNVARGAHDKLKDKGLLKKYEKFNKFVQ